MIFASYDCMLNKNLDGVVFRKSYYSKNDETMGGHGINWFCSVWEKIFFGAQR